LGDGYFYVGNLKLAESWKKNAAQQSKGKIAYPYQTLADIYILKTQYEKAVDALHTYHRLKKEKNEGGVTEAQAYVQSKIALIHYQQKQYREALRYIKLSLQLYDNDNIIDSTAEEHWLKGVILLALGNEKEAEVELEWLRIFKNTWKLDRDNFNAALKYFIHLEALILEKKGKSDQAMEKFKELIAMKSRLSYWITYYYYQYFHTEYAAFLHRNGYLGQALEELDRCLEFNDDYIPALKLKEELLLKLNKPEAAAKVKEKLKKQLEPL
jgi:tetratricopeptide (TPR) repeat protein